LSIFLCLYWEFLGMVERHMKKILLALVFVALLTGRATAADFYWDADADATGNMTDGTNLGGTGTWDTSTLNWWDGVAVSDVTWPDSNTAIFIGLPGQVQIPASNIRTVTGLRFKTDGFEIAGQGATVATFGATAFGAVNALLWADPGVVGNVGSKMTGTGGFTVDGGGTIRFSAVVNSSGTTGPVTIQNGSTLELAYSGAIGGTGAGAGAITLTGDSTLRNTNDSITAANNNVTFLTGNRSIILQGAAGNTLVPQSTGLYSGIISGTILKMTNNPAAANNELRLSGGAAQVNTFQKLSIDAVNDSYTTFSVGQASTLGNDANFGAVPVSFMQDNITLANGGALRFLGASTPTETITLNANRGITLAGGSGRFRADTAHAAIPGKITGAGTLVKATGLANADGSFTLTITGDNDYSGGTRVEEGVLRVNNTTGSGTGSGPVTVTTGLASAFGTLAGTGTVAGAVTLDPGGHLAPGDRPPGSVFGMGNSVFTIGGVSLATGTFLDSTLGASGNSDVLKITTPDTGLDLNGGTLTISAASDPSNQTFTLIEYPAFGGAQGYTGSLGSLVINNNTGFELGPMGVFDDPTNRQIKVQVGTTPIARTWIRESDSGFWGDGPNWSTGSQANGANSTANFPTLSPIAPNNPMPAQTVTIGDLTKTVGTLNLNAVQTPDVNGDSYTIASASVTTIRLNMNAFGSAKINVLSGNHRITAPITFETATDVDVSGSSVLTMVATGGSTYQNVGGMTKTGTGTLLITGADWGGFGPTTINGGVLQFASDNSAGLSNVSNVTVGPNGTLDMNSVNGGAGPSVNDTFNSLAGSGPVINHGNLTLASVGLTGPVEYSGKFSLSGTPFGTRTFTKNGPGTQILSGMLETGGTFTTATVAGGTLKLNNPSGSLTTSAGVLTVNSGATLGGNGYIDGPVTIASGPGTLSPGDGGIGTLHLTTTGNLTFSASSAAPAAIAIDLNTTIADGDISDLIDAPSATITVSNNTLALKPRINITNAGTMTGGTYTLINYGTLPTATFDALVSGLTLSTKPSGFLYKLVDDTVNKKLLLDVQFTGDFNNDNKVDAADYTVWRRNNGLTSGALFTQGDGNGDGAVNDLDYGVWRANFGNSITVAGAGSGLDGGAVPEPAALSMLLIIVSALTILRRPR
jgi:fibronectin-binding autotransporter adhesin